MNTNCIHKDEVSHKDEIRLTSEASHHMGLEKLDKKAMECEKYLLEQGYERGDEAGQDYDTWHKRLNEETSGIGYGGIGIKEQCRNQEDYREKYLKADSVTPKWETTTTIKEIEIDDPNNWDFPVRNMLDPIVVTSSPFEYQVGGDHYKNFKIQPIEFILANEIPWLEANALKYLCRHKQKGERQDLEKVIHYVQMAIEHYYGEKEKD